MLQSIWRSVAVAASCSIEVAAVKLAWRPMVDVDKNRYFSLGSIGYQ